jgi:hypothetical protein
MKFLKILILFAVGIFLISSASAMIVLGGWNNGIEDHITITNGQSIIFNADFGTMHRPMTISAKLYNSGDNLIYTFLNTTIDDYSYQPTYNITPAIYSTSGNYELILTGTDKANSSDSITLYLTVNPLPPPANHAPVITTIPNQTINESLPYSYQVVATDLDGDSLTYFLNNLQ